MAHAVSRWTRVGLVNLVAAASVMGCTKPNPTYCDEQDPSCDTEEHCDFATSTCVTGTFDAPSDPDAPPSACQLAGGKIVFSTERYGVGTEVVLANADGTDLQRLTDADDSDEYPTLSSDGTRIIWAHEHDYWIMNSDGSDKRILLIGTTIARWAPDGQRILATYSVDANAEICTIDADGTGFTNLTKNSASDTQADWSPDSTKIAFVSSRADPLAGVYTMNADGTNQILATSNSTVPRWAPTDDLIAFIGSTGTLWTGPPNGGGTSIADVSVTAEKIALDWSPDGQWLAFVSEGDVWKLRRDGASLTNLTDDGVTLEDRDPRWSPDGQRLVYWKLTADGTGEVFTMNAEGSEIVNVSNDPGSDARADWGPCPE